MLVKKDLTAGLTRDDLTSAGVLHCLNDLLLLKLKYSFRFCIQNWESDCNKD